MMWLSFKWNKIDHKDKILLKSSTNKRHNTPIIDRSLFEFLCDSLHFREYLISQLVLILKKKVSTNDPMNHWPIFFFDFRLIVGDLERIVWPVIDDSFFCFVFHYSYDVGQCTSARHHRNWMAGEVLVSIEQT